MFDDLRNNYKGTDIYIKNSDNFIGNHSLNIIGYGFENKNYFWLVENSWVEDWGNNGLGKIKFGEIGMEKVIIIEPYRR